VVGVEHAPAGVADEDAVGLVVAEVGDHAQELRRRRSRPPGLHHRAAARLVLERHLRVDSLPAFRDHLHVRTLALAWLLAACSSPSEPTDAPLRFDPPLAVDAPRPDAPDALVIGDSGGPPVDAGPDGGPTVTLTIVFQGSGAGQVKVAGTNQSCS